MLFYVGISMKAFLRRWLTKRPKGSEGSSHRASGRGNGKCKAPRRSMFGVSDWQHEGNWQHGGKRSREEGWGAGWDEVRERATWGKVLQPQEGIYILFWMKWEARGRVWICSDLLPFRKVCSGCCVEHGGRGCLWAGGKHWAVRT